MTPTEAIRAIKGCHKYPHAVALADDMGRQVELIRLTATNDRRFQRSLHDEGFLERFVGVYDDSSSFRELMTDILFSVRSGLASTEGGCGQGHT